MLLLILLLCMWGTCDQLAVNGDAGLHGGLAKLFPSQHGVGVLPSLFSVVG
jgi:hypothetical protein